MISFEALEAQGRFRAALEPYHAKAVTFSIKPYDRLRLPSAFVVEFSLNGERFDAGIESTAPEETKAAWLLQRAEQVSTFLFAKLAAEAVKMPQLPTRRIKVSQ